MPNRAFTRWLVEHQRDRLLDWLQRVPREDWEQPGPQGGWSLKDLVGHLTLWNEVGLAMLEPVLSGEEPKPWPMSSREELDRLNAEDLVRRRDLSVAAAWEQFEESMRKVDDLLDTLPDDALEPGSDPQGILLSNTYGHWPEHMAQLRLLVKHLGG